MFLPEQWRPFYRIFNLPTDEKVYEIFKCRQWNKRFHMEITTISGQRVQNYEIALLPTIPFKTDGMSITLGAVTMPQTPDLDCTFISDGSHLAIWRHDRTPNLVCDSREKALSLNCSVNPSCGCEPAENRISCACTDLNVTEAFTKEVENRLPARRTWITF
ncbi:hypothetical protein GCK32_015165 [Trichostrongylus colubriformis]|uniref:Phlebovirus glycoprotein G2 fusion domain-containing protein n=1 Tax=Trichostrongylus colubriformis TaxID=6319 RepID=A0AAN8FB04_TRICO